MITTRIVTSSLLALLALAAGCFNARAGDTPPEAPSAVPAEPPPPDPGGQAPSGPHDALESAIAQVEEAADNVIAGVADGSIDLTKRAPALLMEFTRLSLHVARVHALALSAPAPAFDPNAPVVDPLLAVVEPVDPNAPPSTTEKPATKPTSATKPTTTTTTSPTTTTTAAPTTTTTTTPASADPADKPDAVEKTGITSIDAFIYHAAALSTKMNHAQRKLEGARTKLTTSLGLAKKFKPADATTALKDKLGTGYKITLSPVSVTPGPDAKDPTIVTNVSSAITDLQAVGAVLPEIVKLATEVGQEGAQVPTKAKADLEKLGAVGSAQALVKVSKSTKTVAKIPTDAKTLSEEVAMWTKILGG